MALGYRGGVLQMLTGYWGGVYYYQWPYLQPAAVWLPVTPGATAPVERFIPFGAADGRPVTWTAGATPPWLSADAPAAGQPAGVRLTVDPAQLSGAAMHPLALDVTLSAHQQALLMLPVTAFPLAAKLALPLMSRR